MNKLIGGILLAVGTLIAGVSGICTLVVVGSSLASPNEWTGGGASGLFGSFMIVLIVGGIPFLLGLGLFLLGRRMLRRDDAATSPADAADPPHDDEAPKTPDESGQR
jgi:hypothetical protein